MVLVDTWEGFGFHKFRCLGVTFGDPLELALYRGIPLCATPPRSSPKFYQPTSADPTVDPSLDLSVHLLVDLSVDLSVDPSVDPSVDLPVDPSVDASVDPSVDPPVDPSVDPSVDLLGWF